MRTALLLLTLFVAPAALAQSLSDEVGRTEVRIDSGVYPLFAGRTVREQRLEERLERLGYTRTKQRPTQPGAYSLDKDALWIWRAAHHAEGRDWPDELIGLRLGNDGLVIAGTQADGQPLALDGRRGRWLEPEVLGESTREVRAPRIVVRFAELPQSVWQPLLALEDTRFFEHLGVDGRAIARAALANMRSGGVSEGGSTITQQLVKNRDLTSKRSLDRKASEAVRALFLEAEYSKEDILEAYLNTVYYGHVDGVGVYGLGAASRAYFGKDAKDLSLAESATLAAVVQGPNGLSPIRHADKAQARRDHALDRMQELGWASAADVAAAKAQPVRVHLKPPRAYGASELRAAALRELKAVDPERAERDLGFRAQTTVDPLLQAAAEEVVAAHLKHLRASNPRLRNAKLQAAVVAVDGLTGDVLAYVGGDPSSPSGFNRAALAERQPGSAVKPLVVLEALDRCGTGEPLNPASRVADDPLSVQVDGHTTWSPDNYDGRDHGVVDLRTALRSSYNRPIARVALHCGLRPTAERLERAGLPMPKDPPPSFALGAIEATPLQLAGAFTTFVDLGTAHNPVAITRLERPGGADIARERGGATNVSSTGAAFLVRDLLRDAVQNGTGKAARVKGVDVVGKTGTSNNAHDAWFVGSADRVVFAVWVGLDEGGDLGLTGGQAAAPIFHDLAAQAAATRPRLDIATPSSVVQHRVDPASGLLIGDTDPDGRDEWFLRRAQPRRNQFWRVDAAEAVLR